jgi:hypothetical protein
MAEPYRTPTIHNTEEKSEEYLHKKEISFKKTIYQMQQRMSS